MILHIGNIKELVKNGKLEVKKLGYKIVSHNYDSFKIYVRHLSDVNYVTSHARNFFNLEKDNSPILISDICRSNLLLEIEGIYDYEFR